MACIVCIDIVWSCLAFSSIVLSISMYTVLIHVSVSTICYVDKSEGAVTKLPDDSSCQLFLNLLYNENDKWAEEQSPEALFRTNWQRRNGVRLYLYLSILTIL